MREILELLERDAHLSHDTIATMIGVPVEEVAAQVAAWEQAGVIRRYRAVIDWDKVERDDGPETVTAFIDVSVAPARSVGFDDVAARIYRFPEVHSVYLVSGGYDLLVVVEGKSMKEVAFFVAERLATIDRVHSTATHFLLKKYKEDQVVVAEHEEDRRLAVTP